METAIQDRISRIEVAQVAISRVWKICKKDTGVFASALKRMAKSEFRRKAAGKDIDFSLLPPDDAVMPVSEVNKRTGEPETRSVVMISGGMMVTSDGGTVDLDLVDAIDLLDIADRVEYLYAIQERMKEKDEDQE